MRLRRREENCLEAFKVRSHFICIIMHLDSSEYHRTGGVAGVPSLVNELPCGNNVLEDRHACARTLCQRNQLEVAEEITGIRCCQGCQICRIEDAEEVIDGKGFVS